MHLADLTTPALVVDEAALESNLAAMAARWPGETLRPHVKAHKTTALAARQAAHGATGFTCATIREVEGMAAAGLGQDLLLANEVLDTRRLGRLDARVTVAVDSPETIDAAVAGGVREVLIDVNVGMPRCGCRPAEAGALADKARAAGLHVRGVMGYEGHLQAWPDPEERARLTTTAMELLLAAHRDVGGDVVSGGGTGTSACNPYVTEMQAGSYALMDSAYTAAGVGYAQALHVLGTVVHTSVARPDMPAYAVADVGLKALGMDHGNPTIPGAQVWFCSDEHVTFAADDPVRVGDRVLVTPAHVDPTVAYHERMHVVRDEDVLETWPVDLRGW
ncbi:alanine racemase [Actinomycetospora sp. CA-084318]|uniref:alanine racemase n=1 Tax=Actinomycetospora sp. CA-084318 TaxID=3239892 RepID=UPI003D97EE17